MGIVFDIQRFSLHDGPGLRTTVFLKGCPLRCRWCSNPESQTPGPVIMLNRDRCMRCLSCAAVCPSGCIRERDAVVSLDRNLCVSCAVCVEACPTGSISFKGEEMTAAEVLAEVEKDRTFYETSGGGMTVSGGEPFVQFDFLMELLTLGKRAGIRTAIETTACADGAHIEQALPLLDTVFVDLKHTDSARHEEWTGVPADRIKENIVRIACLRPDVCVRIPVIPGFNTDAAAFSGFADFLKGLSVAVELLPYHMFGEGKYGMLDRAYPGGDIAAEAAPAEAARLRAFLAERGIEAEITV